MEGGTLPWKTQKIVNNSPDIESFCKPLPNPPSGYTWRQLKDESWVLIETEASPSNSDRLVKVTDPCVIEHVVMPNDTLQGICLRYKISAVELRRVNLFSGNNIKFLKTLKIPLAPGVQFELPVNDHETMVRRFANMTNEGLLESRIYLEDHGWDVDRAYAQWQKDEQWHIESVKQAVSNTVVPAAVVIVDDDNKRRQRQPEYIPNPDGDEGVQLLTIL